MVRMPIKTIAISAAIALALVLLSFPLTDVAQASSPQHGWMMHDGGSARFEPNELPDPFVRDFDGDCEWWQYELKNGTYVRTYCLCRYGDAEISYRKDVRTQWYQALSDGTLQLVTTTPAPSTAGDVSTAVMPAASTAGDVTQAAEAAPSTAGDVTQAAEAAPSTAGDMAQAVEEEAAAEEPAAEAEMAEMPADDIVATLIEKGDFSALLAAIGTADLAETLHEAGPYTVFAPNDVAFMTLPEGALAELMANPEGDLAQTVLYHIAKGEFLSKDLVDGQELETLQGSLLLVERDGDTINIGGASLLFPDIEASNGVIHVIDQVLSVPAQ